MMMIVGGGIVVIFRIVTSVIIVIIAIRVINVDIILKMYMFLVPLGHGLIGFHSGR